FGDLVVAALAVAADDAVEQRGHVVFPILCRVVARLRTMLAHRRANHEARGPSHETPLARLLGMRLSATPPPQTLARASPCWRARLRSGLGCRSAFAARPTPPSGPGRDRRRDC